MKRLTTILRETGYRFGWRIERIYPGDSPIPLQEGQFANVFDLAIRANSPEREGYTFIQIGAHDGAAGDPIRQYVERYRWRGVLLEPQPQIFPLLQENYRGFPNLTLVNAAAAPQDGKLTLYRPSAGSTRYNERTDSKGGVETFLATAKPSVLDKSLSKTGSVEKFEVDAISFPTLLSKYNIQKVDLLQVDTEGYDFEILKMFLQTSQRPGIIHFEHRHLDKDTQVECAAYLVERGYRLASDPFDTVALLSTE